ncbi:MAG: hypothetical protein C0483_02975 [Pirellula sp.]|nr:hypothetical protein [Pirellula sp.]
MTNSMIVRSRMRPNEPPALRSEPPTRSCEPRSWSVRRRWAIVGLVVLWFVPRLAIALKEDVLFPDGVTYIGLAARMESAATNGTLDPREFNAYPTILMLLHQLGCDWETAGRVWGVLCGTLVVLPLFGWLRRMFNDEIAVVGSVLAGLHPKLIEWSPQLIRDPTFCLFAVCSLYASWRAVSELRLKWFLAAGLATFAAVQTRFEGWFLLLPQIAWSVSRVWRMPDQRRSLAWGWLTYAAMLPLGILAINAAFGGLFNGRVSGGNLHKITYLQHVPGISALIPAEWFPNASPLLPPSGTPEGVALPPPTAPQALLTASPEGSVTAPSPNSEVLIGSAPPAINALQVTWLACRVLVRGFGPFYAALFVIGLVGERRRFNADQRAILSFFVATMLAIWLHTWQSKVTSSRYALPLVLAGAPFAATGCLAVAAFLQRRSSAMQSIAGRMARFVESTPQQVATALLLGIAALITFTDSFLAHDAPFRSQQALGRWVRQEVGPGRRLAGSETLSVAAYYSAADYFYKPSGPEPLASLIANQSPEVLILTSDVAAQAGFAPANYRRVDVAALPPECRSKYVVLIEQPLQARRSETSRSETSQR